MRLDNLEQRGGGAISIQTRDGGLFDAIVFGEQEAGPLDGGQRVLSPLPAASSGDDRNRGDEAGRSTWRSPMPPTARSASFAMAGPTARLTSRRARSRFPPARLRLSSVSGTPRPAATGCWPGRSCGHGVYDRALDAAEVAASAATFGDYVDPEAIAAALTPERRAGA